MSKGIDACLGYIGMRSEIVRSREFLHGIETQVRPFPPIVERQIRARGKDAGAAQLFGVELLVEPLANGVDLPRAFVQDSACRNYRPSFGASVLDVMIERIDAGFGDISMGLDVKAGRKPRGGILAVPASRTP